MKFDLEVDWLVAGSGAAGMTGAIVAHECGGDVLLVEKERCYGGTTARSGGVAWIPGNAGQAELGISDNAADAFSYLNGLIGDSVPEARLRAYAERAPEMLEFMMANSHVDYRAIEKYMDYYEHIPGYKSGGRSMDVAPFSRRQLGAELAHLSDEHYAGLLLPFNVTVNEGQALQRMDWRAYLVGAHLLLRYLLDIPARLRADPDNRLTLGRAAVARLRRSMMDRRIPLWLNSPMQELLLEEGVVVGAVIARDGVEQRVAARRGVLLATGGFSQNHAMRKREQQTPIGNEWTASAPGANGDGIVMGRQVGAGTGFMKSAWWSPTYCLPDGRRIALIAGKAYPGSIMVNRRGRRFANEAQPYEDLVKAQYASEARGEGAIPCYLVFDAVYRSKYAVGHIKPGSIADDSKIPRAYFESGLFVRANTLRELADQIGVDVMGLEETVKQFNRSARLGSDPEFGRGDTIHDRYYADHSVTPNPSLGPLEQAPYYALRCEAGDLDTKGGILCDEFGRALTPGGEVVPGLYAAGNTSAAVMGDTYPGAGATIGSAMTFAYIAARTAFASSEGETE